MTNEQIEKAAKLYCVRKGIDPEKTTHAQSINGFFLREWQLIAAQIRERRQAEMDAKMLAQAIDDVVCPPVALGYTNVPIIDQQKKCTGWKSDDTVQIDYKEELLKCYRILATISYWMKPAECLEGTKAESSLAVTIRHLEDVLNIPHNEKLLLRRKDSHDPPS